MEHEEEFLNTFFTQVAQLCTDKAKELVVSDYSRFLLSYYFRLFNHSLF